MWTSGPAPRGTGAKRREGVPIGDSEAAARRSRCYGPPGKRANAARETTGGAAVSGVFGCYAVLPALNGWAASFTWVTAVAASQANVFLRGDPSGETSSRTFRDAFNDLNKADKPGIVAGLVFLPVPVAWVAFYGEQYAGALTRSAGSDNVAVVVSGLLLVVFVGNDLAYLAVRPYLSRLSTSGANADSIVPSGIYVGWVERAVIFTFVAGGQADAAALAVATKALFRLPEVQDEEKGSILGEYIIVGTLASALISISGAVAVRLALGLSAL